MEAEMAALSQLQLQLLALVSDHRLIRERERAVREDLQACSQRWKEAEEEHRQEAREIRAEVAVRDDALSGIESRVKCLENENELLGRNEKDLKESMEALLQSREAFIKHYEDSSCSMQWTIQMKDKQIAVISEKLNSHLALFSSVGKEVAAVKLVLGDVECLVGEQETVVSDLNSKVQRISVLEKDFVEKLNFLGEKISGYQLELRKRARIIYELTENLDAEKLNTKFQIQLKELKKSLLVKDEIIERLTSDKQELLIELHNMEVALGKFQDIFSSIGHVAITTISPVCVSQDICDVNNDQIEATTTNLECQLGIEIGSKHTAGPVSVENSSLPPPDQVIANSETTDCILDHATRLCESRPSN